MQRIVRSTVLTVLAAAVLSACGGGRQEPTTTPAQLDFGVKMAQRGLWNEALFRFDKASDINPADARVLNNKAVAFEALGQFDEALEHYQMAIQKDPANRDLKRNYSRFVEFYRAFKPDEGEDDESGSR